MLLFVGKIVDPHSLQDSRWWMCVRLHGSMTTAQTRRRAYTSGNTLRFIEEQPSTVSDVSVSSTWFSPGVTFVLQQAFMHGPCEQQTTMLWATCLQKQETRTCSPMEPIYGSALVSIPGNMAFVTFGGRAAVDMVNDIPECSAALGSLAWRFQYHSQLTSSVQVAVNGTSVGALQLVLDKVSQVAWLTDDAVS